MPRKLVSHVSCTSVAVLASLCVSGQSFAQSGATGVQGASPSADQYGVGFDGSAPGCVSPLLSLASNLGENVAPGSRMLDIVDLYTGGLTQSVAGIALPATVPWIVPVTDDAP